MLIKLLTRTFQRRWRRIGLTTLSVALGATLVAALLTVTAGISERVSRELQQYGANMVVEPDIASGASYIDTDALPKLKSVFWRHNIVTFAPFLDAPVTVAGRKVTMTGTWFERRLPLPEGSIDSVGVYTLYPWWKVHGRAPKASGDGVLVGEKLAAQLGVTPGKMLDVAYGGQTRTLKVAGLLTSGGVEDERIVADIDVVQELTGLDGKAQNAKVSAMIVPENKLPASIRGKSPKQMTPKEYETWYCTPTLGSISTQIKEAVPGANVKVVRQVAQAQGDLLGKIDSLVSLIIAITLLASAVGVAASMSAAVVERRKEIALSKAIGATDSQVAQQFLIEAALLGLLAGLAGLAGGIVLARYIGQAVFATIVPPTALASAATIAMAVGVALAGSAVPVLRASKVDPAVALRGE